MLDTDSDPVVIVSAARTPMGSFQGVFSDLPASELGARAIAGAVTRCGIPADEISEVIMGCVLTAGQGQAPARQAALKAELPAGVPATTVNKMCGSGMKAVMLAADALLARPRIAIVAGGMESMTNAPYLLRNMRAGARLGHAETKDHMFLDGLEDGFGDGRLMGCFAEDTAEALQISRALQDDFAAESLRRAQRATEDGTFEHEIVPVEVKGKKGIATISSDEHPRTADIGKIPTLRPAFRKDGTVTPANSSSISDGAAAVVLMRASEAQRRKLRPLAHIKATATFAREPAGFPQAPIGAIESVLASSGWHIQDVDLFEINEAFAVVALAAMRALDLPHDKVNVHGGACALGHPIGASGARIIVTLLAAMEKYDLHRGIATACIGGGEATAVAIERPRMALD